MSGVEKGKSTQQQAAVMVHGVRSFNLTSGLALKKHKGNCILYADFQCWSHFAVAICDLSCMHGCPVEQSSIK
ncbi:hypothetical protein H6G74_28315 [Nostoc spongiaeforme FACHB-130]|uniref:Uncharacterized protein n=1 Tax=Nostoc spongiaeforme FACHB-130 TaxID=1357510 RepID=A0ABR8G4K5_9NOSO|nr:hypothetical protein [Nostoc spongiaeforme]MBD2598200.1 hypothetical protein [Nostoc spongiaeforme FACHB-130]